MIRKGSAKNVIVFPEADYDNSAFGFSNNQYTFTHSAIGADLFRYSANFGMNWTDWQNMETTSTLNNSLFDDKGNFWTGQHVMMQCEF